jgi:hypothetical protein
VDLLLLTAFFLSSGQRLLGSAEAGTFFVDLRIYRQAVIIATCGGDPWASTVGGFAFAGPPPSLVAYIPAALLPEGVAICLYLAVWLVIGVWVVRRLRCQLWWLLFPPLFESILVINTDLPIIALLLLRGPAAGVAAAMKVYALVPLLLSRRWVATVFGSALVLLLGLPLWADFLNSLPEINERLAEQASGGLSAWGSWVAIPTVAALWVLRRHLAAWLAVPALWPSTQLHYNVLALPVAVRNPMVAFLLSFAVWPLPAVAAMIAAAPVAWRWLAFRRRERVRSSAEPSG